MRGRKPLKIKRIADPATLSEVPPAPDFLCEVGRAEWDRIARIVFERGDLTAGDLTLLSIRCSLFAEWREASDRVAELGRVVKSPAGYPVQNPFLSIARQAADRIAKIDGEFGLSPVARGRLKTAKPKPPDSSKAKFFADTGA